MKPPPKIPGNFKKNYEHKITGSLHKLHIVKLLRTAVTQLLLATWNRCIQSR